MDEPYTRRRRRHSSSEVPRDHLRRDAGERGIFGDHRLDERIDVAEERHVEAAEDLNCINVL